MDQWLSFFKNEYFVDLVKLAALLVIALIGFFAAKKFILPLIHRFFQAHKNPVGRPAHGEQNFRPAHAADPARDSPLRPGSGAAVL